MCYEEKIELDLQKFIRALQKAKNIVDKFGKPYRFAIGNFRDPESGSVTWFVQFIIDHDNYGDLLKLWDNVSETFHKELGNNINLEIEPERREQNE
ncbi:hypothetical protein J7K27_00805 [Candidatus Bathyarchaeota archaeon]|nr:hypothetical protein [Candidatus Bathyarchaeota archaeon]